MSRHVHLPPWLPVQVPAKLEKSRKAKRKAATWADAEPVAAAVPPGATAGAAPAPPSDNPLSSRGPIDGATGALAVLLTAQEEAQPADALTRRPDGADEDDEDLAPPPRR